MGFNIQTLREASLRRRRDDGEQSKVRWRLQLPVEMHMSCSNGGGRVSPAHILSMRPATSLRSSAVLCDLPVLAMCRFLLPFFVDGPVAMACDVPRVCCREPQRRGCDFHPSPAFAGPSVCVYSLPESRIGRLIGAEAIGIGVRWWKKCTGDAVTLF